MISRIKHLFTAKRGGARVAEDAWNSFHVAEDGRPIEVLSSAPPPGMFKVVNLYVDPISGKLAIQYDDGQ